MRLLGLIAGAALVLGACSSSGGASSSASARQLRVVASFYPLAEAAQRVGDQRVRVENLTPAGAEPHDLELKASQVADVQDAAVVLVLGKGFQPAVEKAAAGRKGTVELLNKLPIEQRGKVDDAAPIGSSGTLDPHVWLDPVLMASVVDQVTAALTAADPDASHAAEYQSNAATFKAQLADLDTSYRTGLATCARHEIVTSHEAFGRLAARYGLTQQGILGLSPDAEPAPDRLAQLTDYVKAHGVTTVFTETLVSPKVAQTLAREAGVKTDVLNPLEGLTKDQIAKGDNYVSVMGDNLAKLRAALGCP
jgi:zinc transport system substrate-binding protein